MMPLVKERDEGKAVWRAEDIMERQDSASLSWRQVRKKGALWGVKARRKKTAGGGFSLYGRDCMAVT